MFALVQRGSKGPQEKKKSPRAYHGVATPVAMRSFFQSRGKTKSTFEASSVSSLSSPSSWAKKYLTQNIDLGW